MNGPQALGILVPTLAVILFIWEFSDRIPWATQG